MIRWHKVRTVAMFEFMAVVKRTGFLVVTFGMPLFVAGRPGTSSCSTKSSATSAAYASRSPPLIRSYALRIVDS